MARNELSRIFQRDRLAFVNYGLAGTNLSPNICCGDITDVWILSSAVTPQPADEKGVWDDTASWSDTNVWYD